MTQPGTATPVIHTSNGAPVAQPASQLSKDDFKQLMSCWCTGVAVVTTADGGEPAGCTVNAITSVSLEPPLLLVGLSAESRTLAAILDHRRLAVNILSAQQMMLVRQFSHGIPARRFAGVDYQWTDGVPVLSQVVVAAVCVAERFLPVADHVLVIAEPVWVRSASRGRPLVGYGRSYWSLWSMGVVGQR